MPTRSEVLQLVSAGVPYESIGERFGIVPGLAYMIATGLPADGSDVLSGVEPDRQGLLDGSSQHLSNPPTELPKHQGSVESWMRARAAADGAMQAADAARTAEPPEVRAQDDSKGGAT